MAVDKVTWQQVGRVTDPGRYLFKFGWLTITADDLAVWKRFPHAAFTLVRTPPPAIHADSDAIDEQLHLGAFELREDVLLGEEQAERADR